MGRHDPRHICHLIQWASVVVGLIVLTLSDDRICAMTRFENGVLP